jgi:Uri superfamily endonuclease
MRKCKTCGIIGHPHKDFYPTSYRTLCKRCRPALRELSFEKALVSRPKYITFCDLVKLRNRINEREKLNDLKTKQLKRRIKENLNIIGLFYCRACKKPHSISDKLTYSTANQRICKEGHQLENKKWREQNPYWVKKYYKTYMKEYKKDDTLYKFYTSIKQLVAISIKGKGYTKKSRTHEILGCDFETFKKHIERQFTKGMDWNNRNEWHIDHIYPISKAKTEEEAIRLNHYTNLRPMWASENISKSNKIIEHQRKLAL